MAQNYVTRALLFVYEKSLLIAGLNIQRYIQDTMLYTLSFDSLWSKPQNIKKDVDGLGEVTIGRYAREGGLRRILWEEVSHISVFQGTRSCGDRRLLYFTERRYTPEEVIPIVTPWEPQISHADMSIRAADLEFTEPK
jgi:hypothetical protein